MENDNEMQISTQNCNDVISNVVQKLISPVQYVETMERNHNKQISELYSLDRIRSGNKERMLVSSAEFDCSLEADTMLDVLVNGMNHYSMLIVNDEQVYEGSSKLKGRKTKANESQDSVVDDCDKDVVQHSSPIVDEKNKFNVFTSNIKHRYNLQKQATSRLESIVDVDENMEDNDVFSRMQTKRTTEESAKFKEATIELPASDESNSIAEVKWTFIMFVTPQIKIWSSFIIHNVSMPSVSVYYQ